MVLQTNIISRGLNRSNSSLAMFKLLMFQVINMGFVKVFPFVISVAIQFTVHLLNLLIWYLKLNMLQSSIFSKPKFPSSGVSLQIIYIYSIGRCLNLGQRSCELNFIDFPECLNLEGILSIRFQMFTVQFLSSSGIYKNSIYNYSRNQCMLQTLI